MIKAIVVILSLVPTMAFADSPVQPYSHTVQSTDGRWLFVMLAPCELEDEVAIWNDTKVAEIKRIRSKFPASGLYVNDGANTPIWTVDWYAHTALPLNDGIHLVRRGPWARSSGDEAVSFFKNGALVHSYRVRDLVAIPMLMPRSVSHFTWQSDTHLNDDAKTYMIKTKLGERYVFDVRTGKMTSSFSPIPLIGLALAAGLIAVGYVVWRRRIMNNKTFDQSAVGLSNSKRSLITALGQL